LKKLAPDYTQLQMNQTTICYAKTYDKALANWTRCCSGSKHTGHLYKTFVLVQQRDFQRRAVVEHSAIGSKTEALTAKASSYRKQGLCRRDSSARRVLKRIPATRTPCETGPYLPANGQSHQSEKDYTLLVRMMPRYYAAYYGRGDCFSRKDTEEAIRV
jgi:hypothetical protein